MPAFFMDILVQPFNESIATNRGKSLNKSTSFAVATQLGSRGPTRLGLASNQEQDIYCSFLESVELTFW